MNSRIVRLELTPVHVPFHDQVVEAMERGPGGLGMALAAEEPWLGGDFVILRLMAEDGSVGLGEVFVWLPETGVGPGQVIDQIVHALGRYVLGADPFQVRRILDRMDRNVARSEVAKGLIDMALYDLMGRIAGRPAVDFMGGAMVEEIPLAALVPLADDDFMLALAQEFVRRGHRTLRVKLGLGLRHDERIMGRLRESVGPGIRFRVDYNQAYSPDEAVRAILAIEPLGIDVAEQPVAAADWLGLARVQSRVNVPLMAHEGCFSLTDLTALIEMGAVGAAGINSERPGGVTRALEAIDYAHSRGLGTVIHNQPLGIASAMHLALASARYAKLGHDVELFGQIMLKDDLIREPIEYRDGLAVPPAGPGWGVDLDEAALADYATAPTVVAP